MTVQTVPVTEIPPDEIPEKSTQWICVAPQVLKISAGYRTDGKWQITHGGKPYDVCKKRRGNNLFVIMPGIEVGGCYRRHRVVTVMLT